MRMFIFLFLIFFNDFWPVFKKVQKWIVHCIFKKWFGRRRIQFLPKKNSEKVKDPKVCLSFGGKAGWKRILHIFVTKQPRYLFFSRPGRSQGLFRPYPGLRGVKAAPLPLLPLDHGGKMEPCNFWIWFQALCGKSFAKELYGKSFGARVKLAADWVMAQFALWGVNIYSHCVMLIE